MPPYNRADFASFRLPPVPFGHEALDAAAGEFKRWASELATEDARLRELQDSRAAAQEADAEAFKEAIAAGRKDPGQKNLERVLRDAEQSARRVDALGRQVVDARAALEVAVEEHRGEFEAENEALIAERREGMHDAIRELLARRESLAQALSMRIWLSGFPDRAAWSGPAELSEVRGLRAPHGGPYAFEAVVEALSEYGKEPEPRPAQPVQPLRPSVRTLSGATGG